MREIFITNIYVGKVRHFRDVEIALSETERRHLILTGKNGSGKTSLLEAMRDSIFLRQKQNLQTLSSDERSVGYLHDGQQFTVTGYTGVNVHYSQEESVFAGSIFAYIPAERTKLALPSSLEPMVIEAKTAISRNASKDFLKYILSLDYQLYGAKSDGNKRLEANLEHWFDQFLAALRKIYDCETLRLQRDAKNLVFNIEMPDREPFGLHQMADGYAAFLDIYMELLMRFEEAEAVVDYAKPAIVLIDEIETHMHVELQKRVLPFLTQMFPNVQFIVSTHSPFVITSLDNAVIFDLEKKERLENPSFYSYKTVVESFLDTDMYSERLKNYFDRYKALCFKDRTPEENEEFLQKKLKLEMMALPSTELYIAFQNLENKRRAMSFL